MNDRQQSEHSSNKNVFQHLAEHRRMDQDRVWVRLIQPADRYVITLRRGMVDGLKWHNSLGTISFAAWGLCAGLVFKHINTPQIPFLRENGEHPKTQKRKEKDGGGGG